MASNEIMFYRPDLLDLCKSITATHYVHYFTWQYLFTKAFKLLPKLLLSFEQICKANKRYIEDKNICKGIKLYSILNLRNPFVILSMVLNTNTI